MLNKSADEGVKQQTGESIGWLEEQNIPTLVCLNKIDKICNNLTVNKIINEIKNFQYIENSNIVKISALHNTNIDELKEKILQKLSEVNLKVNINGPAVGTILDVKNIIGTGINLQILIQQGINDFLYFYCFL